jgi:hypothetical protein
MKYSVTRWYAAGVGMVKEEHVREKEVRTTELKKFETGQ